MWVERFLFPRCCVVCSRQWGAYVCTECFNKIPFCTTQHCPNLHCNKPAINGVTHSSCTTRHGLNGHTSITVYSGAMKQILEFYKRRGVFKLESHLFDICNAYFFDINDSIFDTFNDPIMIPVPLYKYEKWFKTYNVAERLAGMLSEILGCTVSTDVLIKMKPTVPQKQLKREDRLINLKGVFAVLDRSGIDERDVILVDDVWTTGSTMRECAKTLKRSGARSVWAVTLCRGI